MNFKINKNLKRTIIIAEAGVNHNGSIKLAKELITIAAKAKADFVKFQTFIAQENITKNAQKADYQKNKSQNDESQLEMIKKLELSHSDHIELIKHSKREGIRFLSTAFDHDSINLLSDFNLPLFKIPSGEITNLPYLRHVGKMNKPIILSTGMANMKEIEFALNILSKSGCKRDDVTILHCNTEYPTPMNDVNLRAMITIRDAFNVRVGYSDHTLGIEIPIAAVAMGATIIEKHFTLDRSLPGPDHEASILPNELESMVKAIRNVEKAKGNGIKKASPSEKKNIRIVRKSIVARSSIMKGEIFSEKNITVKRPGTGLSPLSWDDVIGRNADRNYKKDEEIKI